jgi:hypothetical protein
MLKTPSKSLRFDLVNDIPFHANEIDNFIKDLKKSWNNIEPDTKMSVLIRQHHWLLLELLKTNDNYFLNTYVVESFYDKNNKGFVDLHKKLKENFTKYFQGQLRYHFNEDQQISPQRSPKVCGVYGIDAMYRLEKTLTTDKTPEENEQAIFFAQTRNIENYEAFNMFLHGFKNAFEFEHPYEKYINQHTRQLPTLPENMKNRIATAQGGVDINNMDLYENRGIEYKLNKFKQDTIPFLRFLVTYPQVYKKILAERTGKNYFATKCKAKPSWILLPYNPYVKDNSEIFDFLMCEITSFVDRLTKSGTNNLRATSISALLQEFTQNKEVVIQYINNNSNNNGIFVHRARIYETLLNFCLYGNNNRTFNKLFNNTLIQSHADVLLRELTTADQYCLNRLQHGI